MKRPRLTFQRGDWVLVWGAIYRVMHVATASARLESPDGYCVVHPLVWLSEHQRGFWEGRLGANGFYAWSHCGFACRGMP